MCVCVSAAHRLYCRAFARPSMYFCQFIFVLQKTCFSLIVIHSSNIRSLCPTICWATVYFIFAIFDWHVLLKWDYSTTMEQSRAYHLFRCTLDLYTFSIKARARSHTYECKWAQMLAPTSPYYAIQRRRKSKKKNVWRNFIAQSERWRDLLESHDSNLTLIKINRRRLHLSHCTVHNLYYR